MPRILKNAAASQEPELTSSARAARAQPFLKWAGGKRQLLPQLLARAPIRYERYFEPFAGSGALFFALEPSKAWLSDANYELINTYRVVRDSVEELINALAKYRNERQYFDDVRAKDVDTLDAIERAARVIYLNRTCFNGLYRVNRAGRFNTPFGAYKNPKICNTDVLRAASVALSGAGLDCCDFAKGVSEASEGDFVYLDPPYVPVSEFSDFKRYHSQPFGLEEHRLLQSQFAELASRGCYVMLSNSSTPFTRDLYSAWNIAEVKARRLINRNAGGRSAISEILVTNY